MLTAFSSYLSQRQYSESTIRNYCTDIRKYLDWHKTTTSSTPSSNPSVYFYQKTLLTYFHVISQESSFKRQLASLKLFCQFAQDQQLIHKDIFTLVEKNFNNRNFQSIKKITNQELIIAEFKKYLHNQKASPNTIRNYLADVKDYLQWINA